MKILLCYVIPSLICATAHAELKWEQTTLDLRPAPGEKQATGHFKYENVGTTPIHFKAVKASCGCTTAQTQKDVVNPGDKGEITAIFNIGDRTGLQIKNVTVETDDPDPRRAVTTLVLKTTIPQLLELQPTLVYWHGGEELKPKAIVVKTGLNVAVKMIKVTSSNPEFKTKITPVREGEFKIEVQPPAYSGKASGTTVTVEPEGSDEKFVASAIVTGGPAPSPVTVRH